MDDNKFKIEIKIKEESDLYNSFDKYNKTLSDDLISYVSQKLELATIRDELEIEIISDEKLDEKFIKNTFEEYCDKQLKINDRKNKINTSKQIWLLVTGLIFISISFILSQISESLLYTVVSTIGSFAIWESANSWLLDRKIIKFNKFKLMKLKKSNIVCKNITEI